MSDTKAKKPEVTGYKNHKPNSRKGTIHELYDREGADVAFTRGVRMKLKEGTLRSWMASWARDDKKAKPAHHKPKPKPATKPKKPAKVTKAAKIEEAAAPPPKTDGAGDAAVV